MKASLLFPSSQVNATSAATTCAKSDMGNINVLVCRRLVKESFFERVCEQVCDRFELFQPGVAYTANQICGDLFWNRLKSDETKLVDLCICDLIEQGELPMGKIANSPNGSHQYCLI